MDLQAEKIISSHNEMMFNRDSSITDIIEEINAFFPYDLYVLNDLVDRLDKLDSKKIDRETLKFIQKDSNKNQWTFETPEGKLLTVFTIESFDYLSNPKLTEMVSKNIQYSSDEEPSSSEEDSGKSEDGPKGSLVGIISPVEVESSITHSSILTEGWSESTNSVDSLVVRCKRGQYDPGEIIEF
jgi:hypothetical protein